MKKVIEKRLGYKILRIIELSIEVKRINSYIPDAWWLIENVIPEQENHVISQLEEEFK
jgi:hypothetical protein